MNKAIIKKIADRMVYGNEKNWAMNINKFDWGPGVGLYGIYKVYECTGDKVYLEFLERWTDQHLASYQNNKTVNSTAPFITIYELYLITGKKNYLDACIAGAEYLISEAPLTREGGLEHTVTEDVEGFSEQIWADTLFMACIFMAKCGSIDKKYRDFALDQLEIHHKLLFDNEKKLYFHGWNCEAQNHMSAVHWGRANAWIIYSTMEILNIAGQFAGRETIEEYVKQHIQALSALQQVSGGFSTVLDVSNSYIEISATAGIAAGAKMAYKEKIVGHAAIEIYELASQLMKESVSEDGTVTGVSSGTPIMKNIEEYKNIAICPTLYGQGLAILYFCQD